MADIIPLVQKNILFVGSNLQFLSATLRHLETNLELPEGTILVSPTIQDALNRINTAKNRGLRWLVVSSNKAETPTEDAPERTKPLDENPALTLAEDLRAFLGNTLTFVIWSSRLPTNAPNVDCQVPKDPSVDRAILQTLLRLFLQD